MTNFQRDFDRRDFLRFSLAGALGVSHSGWLPRLAQAAGEQQIPKACILLWMSGGPSQTDTFDLKPGHANGGPVKPISTSVPGVQISENLPGLAKQMQDLAIIRSLTSSEGDHQRGTQLMLTGYRPRAEAVSYPVLGSLLTKELGSGDQDLPGFVSISSFRFAQMGAGFLGPKYAPLSVSGQSNDPTARANLTIENLRPPTGLNADSMENRFELLQSLQQDFRREHVAESTAAHQANYERAMRMVRTEAKSAFRLDQEADPLRDAYGRNRFGQGCLLARRLIERGVSFVEVTLSGTNDNQLGWDTHQENAARVKELCGVLDPAWSTLVTDLRERGLLKSTLVIWMGEFGRTPTINENGGRDHFPLAWSTVLCGGGIRGGQVVGSTGEDGMRVVDRPVTVPELYATVCAALGIDHTRENLTPDGRPIAIVDAHAHPVSEIVS
ncbi:DUF1501 domain-containing protein [Planctomicrobium piriforme]|uniref:Tat (Twin-arginine translocation) pathway signal sequence n=1 Tax=Planctomicrobium piriforme TaxID=1576369 RepID=A0A1I3CI82_9PLAN|nr:DUF1501 domain-containing protein [Planctomicrobium piriforme]SFH74280.1 Protein of unknown function [Planctomicrobium piriforme]